MFSNKVLIPSLLAVLLLLAGVFWWVNTTLSASRSAETSPEILPPQKTATSLSQSSPLSRNKQSLYSKRPQRTAEEYLFPSSATTAPQTIPASLPVSQPATTLHIPEPKLDTPLPPTTFAPPAEPEPDVRCASILSEWQWNPIANRWVCFPKCNHSETAHFTADGLGWCIENNLCPSTLNLQFFPDAATWRCSVKPADADLFWSTAFSAANITDTSHRWIGGLAFAYDRYFWWGAEDAARQNRWEHEWNVWHITSKSALDDFMAAHQQGIHEVKICANHDCENRGRSADGQTVHGWMIGSTDPNSQHCRAYLWHDQIGIWFLMRIDENSQTCAAAYQNVTSGEWRQASLGSRVSQTCFESDPNCVYYSGKTTITINGKTGAAQRLVKAGLAEISFVPFGRNTYTWIDARDLRSQTDNPAEQPLT